MLELAIIVCGGRDYANRERVYATLDKLLRSVSSPSAMLVIEGGARGADTFASDWTRARGTMHAQYPALWSSHGKAAGHIRNTQMAGALGQAKAKRKGVVAFRGGRGTADMVSQAKSMGFVVHEPDRAL